VVIAGLQAQYAQENLAFLKGREFSATMWYDLAREARRIAQRYLDMAIEVAVLMEKAYEAETGRDLRKIKLDYGLDQLNGLLAADALLLDIDYFSLDFVRTKSKKAPMKQTLSLADHFPMAFDQLMRTGRTLFETTLAHFDRRYPGFYLQKVKQVELLFVGLAGTEGVHGTLRNIGLSKFRRRNGSIVDQVYPADVMPLTDYDVRQDAVVFQLSTNELRLFENNGIATVWQLDVPKHSNTFELTQILDVQLVLYYDGFFDPVLEGQVRAALPAKGSGTRSFALRLTAPDELFFLRSQGQAELVLDAGLLPANQANPQLKSYFLQARGPAAKGLKLRVDWAGLAAPNTGHLFTLDAAGNADGAAFAAPTNRTLFDTVRFSVNAADNPQLVKNGVLDLAGLEDLALFVDYGYTFRT
jgi:Tc toxin complex TcA C-terminal TcB-binding domain